ncbi:unnamed protein product, partial [Medioppia subpectinata]
KCIRVGGKHCDLTTVGTDGRHHTFFEMLGNWSFGDYHKKESCRMAWDLLTQVFKLDVNRLVVTYFGGDKQLGLEPDFETRDIWLQIGLAKDRVIPLGSKDNFWEMGETGPCGICTEIHYLLEPTISTNADHLMKNCIEIWNLVFIQYNRDINGKLEPLHRHFVDTGMGLERIVSVVQNNSHSKPYGHSIADPLDISYRILADHSRMYTIAISDGLNHSKPYGHSIADPLDISYRILADHSRMYTIAISDGLKSSYRGTGFILRKIIRKSIGIAGNDFGVSDPRLLLHELSAITADILGEAFPELHHNIQIVDKTIDEEFDKYQAVVSQNRRLVRALTRIDIKYSINLSQEITQKLQTINEEIDVNFKENSLSKQFLDSNRNSLHDIKDILNYFGHKPAALFQTSADGKEFYIQTTVPNEYQKYLKANEWLSHISDKLKSYELLSNKRTNKKCLLKSTSMQQMDEASYEFYNQMIDKVSDKIEECVQRGDHLMVSGVEAKPMETQMNRSEEEVVSKAQSMFEAKRLSRQSGQQLVPNDAIDTQLTVVEEVSLEVTDDHQLNGTQYLCDTPSQRVDNTLTNYEFTPNFENFTQRTPSIFNFNTNSFNTFRTTRFDGVSPLSMNDTALRSELSLTDFNSFESTVTDDQKVITASTPVNANRLSSVDIQRPSKRISSINPYFSPRAGRPSLVNVQNLLENMTNNRKKSCVATNCDSKTVVNQTNSKNCVNKSKKRKKADERISCKSIESSDMSDSTCNLSTRSSRRQRKAVSYKEPSLMSKLRRSDD